MHLGRVTQQEVSRGQQRQPLWEQSLHRVALTMADTCQHCHQAFQARKKYRGFDKRSLRLKLRKQQISVHEALKKVYLYEGPANGYICGSCFLMLERSYKVFQELPQPSTPKKRKDITPLNTPQYQKKVRTSPARPKTPKQGVRFHSPLFASTPMRSHMKSPKQLFASPSLSLSSILHHPSTSVKKRQSSTAGKLKPIVTAIIKSKYYSALRHILSRSPKAAGNALTEIVRQKVSTEMKHFIQEDHPNLGSVDGIGSIMNFSWDKVLKETASKMPTLYAALQGALRIKPGIPPKTQRKRDLIEPRMGLMLSIPMYTLNPRKFKLVQALCGFQLWRSGGSEKLFKCLNHLGVSQSSSTTRKVIDFLCTETDIEMKKYKEALEVNDTQQGTLASNASDHCCIHATLEDHSDSDEDPDFLPLIDDTLDTINTTVSLCTTVDATTESSTLMLETDGVGYAFVWDNIQKMSLARDSCYGNQNQMHLWANAFAAVNRVDPQGLDENDLHLRATDIPLSAYMYSKVDEEMLKWRMTCIVARIIVNHMKHFKSHYQDAVTWHINHAYSDEMAQKSTIINIGIIHENPSTRAGTIGIMSELQKNVPRRRDGKFRVVPCHGDGLSVERMTDAKKARSADVTDIDRLEGLEQTPQEFHHRGLMLQETMNNLFKGTSVGERGTLAQLKNAFDHRNVTTEVMHSFNAVENLMRFATEAHVVYLAMVILGMDQIHGNPKCSDPQASIDDRRMYLNNLCSRIVDVIWLLPSLGEISQVLEAEIPGPSQKWCYCDQDIDCLLVRCSNQDCALGSWFHSVCMDVDENELPDSDWWCSLECKESGSSIHCCCKTVKDKPMVKCALGDECSEGVWFHLDCVHLAQEPDNPWYCSPICAEKNGRQPDYIRNYAVALTWYGLRDMAHRDAIREGDGMAMLANWRLNMHRFWHGNHYKYLIIAHRLLAGVNGWLSPRLIEEIVHNRTCNLKGGPGKNIPMDRVNEFLNNEFKETLSHAHGNYGDETVRRAGKMVGTLAKAIDEAFHLQVAETKAQRTYRKRHDYQDDIEMFVQEYWDDDLFGLHPGREHNSFSQYKPPLSIKNPGKLKERLLRYNRKLDSTRDVLA